MKKRLVVCCDGSWNDLKDPFDTNVVKLAQSVAQVGGGLSQIVYYDEGVGTAGGLDKVLGGAFGVGLERNIQQAYHFLALNYYPGDEVYLFGYSRGAFTVRSLAGMIETVGLLDRGHLTKAPDAFQAYRKSVKEPHIAQEFLDTCSRVIEITALCCWDTVGALGIPDKLPISLDRLINRGLQFHDTTLGKHIGHALHATAIDERRREFEVTPMEGNGITKLVKRWFPGDHGSVGGGTEEKAGISNIALRWMVETLNDDFGLGLKINLGSLEEDHRIYFDNRVGIPFGARSRDLGDQPEFHPSVADRIQDLGQVYQSPALRKHRAGLVGKGQSQFPPVPGQALKLEPGEKATFITRAKTKLNDSRIILEAGARYRCWVNRRQRWQDGKLIVDATGWNLKSAAAQLNFAQEWAVAGLRDSRRVADQDWFVLIGQIGRSEKAPPMVLGNEAVFEATKSGRLYTFANDFDTRLLDKYGNNRGWLCVAIERLA